MSTLTAGDMDAPDFGAGVTIRYRLGLARMKGKVRMLLEIEQVVTSQELQALDMPHP